MVVGYLWFLINITVKMLEFTHLNGRDEVRKGVPEVGIVPEHMLGEKWRDGVAANGCIEHKDQDTNVYHH